MQNLVKEKEIYFDEKLIKKIKNSNSVLLVGHVKPDFDCLGAMLGMREILEILGKNVNLVINEGVAKRYFGIPGVKRIASHVNPLDKKFKLYDVVIILDCENIEQVSQNVLDDTEGIPKISINNYEFDGDSSKELVGNYNFNNPSFSSTSEIICYLSNALNVNLGILSRETLYALYEGIMSKTSNLTTNVSNDTKELSSFLESLIGKRRLIAYENNFLRAQNSKELLAVRSKVLKDNIEKISDEATMTSITLGDMVVLRVNSLDVCAENFSLALSEKTNGIGIVIRQAKNGWYITAVSPKKEEIKVKPLELVKSLSKIFKGQIFEAGAFIPNDDEQKLTLASVKTIIKNSYKKLLLSV